MHTLIFLIKFPIETSNLATRQAYFFTDHFMNIVYFIRILHFPKLWMAFVYLIFKKYVLQFHHGINAVHFQKKF